MQHLSLLQTLDRNVAALRSLAHSLTAPESERHRAHAAIEILQDVKRKLREGQSTLDLSPWGAPAREALAPAKAMLERAGLQLLFSTDAPRPDHQIDTDCAEIQRDFPYVWQRLQALWGRPPCRDYLNSLMTATLDDGPAGFPPSALSSLMRLLAEHDRKFPPSARGQWREDVWDPF